MPSSTSHEAAPALKLFGRELAGTVVCLLRLEPALATRFVLAPARVVHAFGAFLHSPASKLLSAAEQASALLETDARELLRIALPGCDSRLFRLLNRATFPVWPLIRLGELSSLLPEEFNFLRGNLSLTPEMIEKLAETRSLDAPLRRVLRALDHDGERLAAREAVMLLRRAGVEPKWSCLPPKASGKAFVRCILDAFDRLPLAPPALPALPGWRVLTTVGEARAVGRKLKNCLSSTFALAHLNRVLEGSAVLLWSEEHEVLAQLDREAVGHWSLSQCESHRGIDPSAEVLEALTTALAEGRVPLLSSCLSRTLRRLEGACNRDERVLLIR